MFPLATTIVVGDTGGGGRLVCPASTSIVPGTTLPYRLPYSELDRGVLLDHVAICDSKPLRTYRST